MEETIKEISTLWIDGELEMVYAREETDQNGNITVYVTLKPPKE